jgi:hypothetical protein
MGGTTDGSSRPRWRFLAVAGVLVLAACSGRSVYTDGYTAYYNGDYRRAMTEFSALARQGDQKAQFVLRQMCVNGQSENYAYGLAPSQAGEQQWYRDICKNAAVAGDAAVAESSVWPLVF